jgi:flagellar biosynthesis protein FlhG
MRAKPHRRDWEVLGLEPGADPKDVRRAYLERRALYAADSLATYTLIEDDDREALLDRIEEAYQAIIGAMSTARTSAEREELEQIPEGPEPPTELEPGRHLRYHRLHKGMTLAQVSEEIKIRPSLLEKIEHEQAEHLPAAVYVRGFIVQYAKLLGVPEPERVAADYLAKIDGGPVET